MGFFDGIIQIVVMTFIIIICQINLPMKTIPNLRRNHTIQPVIFHIAQKLIFEVFRFNLFIEVPFSLAQYIKSVCYIIQGNMWKRQDAFNQELKF